MADLLENLEPFWTEHAAFGRLSCRGGSDRDDEGYVQYAYVRARGTGFGETHHRRVKGHVLVVPGWNDALLKYREVVQDLTEMGYCVWIYDHRSQGFSSRVLLDSQRTYVESFDVYLDDFDAMLARVRAVASGKEGEEPTGPVFVLAHSMGGLVTCGSEARYREEAHARNLDLTAMPPRFDKMVLCAPMFQMACGMSVLGWEYVVLPHWATFVLAQLNCLLGMGGLPTIGYFRENPEAPCPFKLTHSAERAAHFDAIRKARPDVASPVVTNQWVARALHFQDIVFPQQMHLVDVPSLLLQADEDVFVGSEAQNAFVQKNVHCVGKVFFPGSYHELLREADEHRHRALHLTDAFFAGDMEDVRDAIATSQEAQSTSTRRRVVNTMQTLLAFGAFAGALYWMAQRQCPHMRRARR